MTIPPPGTSIGQSSRRVWNDLGPCRVSTFQERISTSSSTLVIRSTYSRTHFGWHPGRLVGIPLDDLAVDRVLILLAHDSLEVLQVSACFWQLKKSGLPGPPRRWKAGYVAPTIFLVGSGIRLPPIGNQRLDPPATEVRRSHAYPSRARREGGLAEAHCGGLSSHLSGLESDRLLGAAPPRMVR